MDIGGTNCRIALVENNKIIKKEIYATKEIKDLFRLINEFLKKNKKDDIKKACIGFAGPVIEGKAKLTNADLTINRKLLEKKLNIKIFLINDFHAIAQGIKVLKNKDFIVLNRSKFNNKVKMVVGPGTGLGKAYVVHELVFPGEGGLTLMGIEDIHDYSLLDFLRKEYGKQVYYEDILSGKGIINLYKHLAIKTSSQRSYQAGEKIKKTVMKSAEMITKYSNKDELCKLTLKEFTRYFARFTRDSALHLIPSHIYLCGGISPKIKEYLKKYFLKEFVKHRVYSELLKKINISIVLNTDVGLIGAASVC